MGVCGEGAEGNVMLHVLEADGIVRVPLCAFESVSHANTNSKS